MVENTTLLTLLEMMGKTVVLSVIDVKYKVYQISPPALEIQWPYRSKYCDHICGDMIPVYFELLSNPPEPRRRRKRQSVG